MIRVFPLFFFLVLGLELRAYLHFEPLHQPFYL
jgi:hypothetical protein